MSIFITSDSTCDLTKEHLQKYNISALAPLSIYFDDEEHKDGIDISCEDIYKFFERTKTVPKTAAVKPADYEKLFTSLLDTEDEIVHISFSSQLSSCYQNAVIAAENFDGRVKVVDSLSLFGGQALLVVKAAQLRDDGKTSIEIVKEIERLREKVQLSFVINDLTFLSKGGRCSSVAALGANLLGIKPVIEMTDGKLSMTRKIRGKMDFVHEKYIEAILNDYPVNTKEMLIVGHTG
ncbi:MAG: DegV family protein, partial [Clostridiales bacterium]|nr:DegV family protein [Clostridiales bacterium]